jgi:pimeloyl-ACP methyl ester carboxylesterase
MQSVILLALKAILAFTTVDVAIAAPAIQVLGRDFTFSHKIDGFPAKLSEFPDLEINTFITNDGVKLSYWEAGRGEPIIFVPGLMASGAEYFNIIYLLRNHYRVIVLDQRNQGLSQKVDYGTRIERYSMDLKELVDHLGIRQADYCGWSMGATVLWGYIDLFGTKNVRKLVFVDEPTAVVAHADWSAQERKNAGGFSTSPEPLIAAMAQVPPAHPSPDDPNLGSRFMLRESLYFANSEDFANSVIKTDPKYASQIAYDLVTNDWRDVIRHKIDKPTAIFTGEWTPALASQQWEASVIPGAALYTYSKAEQGDHFLMFKNPVKFTKDLQAFLDR